jgi:hypothetical protein
VVSDLQRPKDPELQRFQMNQSLNTDGSASGKVLEEFT